MVWRYGLNRDGYGTLTIDGRRQLAHRAVFLQTRGEVPEGRQVNHLCNRPYCVQPSHLYAGTNQDNTDDSQIFSKENLLHTPWILNLTDRENPTNPLLRRLLDSNRYDGTEPWEPLEQPGQGSLEEFTCPGHDFAIPMSGGVSRICRMCETSEFQEAMIDEQGTLSLIEELCPVARTVPPILEKIAASEFVEESHRETRRRIYRRNSQGFGMGSHELRTCECTYCTQDRLALRGSIQPLLTAEESNILDICGRLEPLITAALQEASAAMMKAWGRSLGLNDEQAQALKEHHGDCACTRSELIRTSRTLEGELGYLLHAMVTFDTCGEMLEDRGFPLIMFRLGLIRVREDDEEQVRVTILPVVEETASRMTMAWERESNRLTMPYLESKPDLRRDIGQLVQVLAMKEILEHLRLELLGRNSFVEHNPHPHSGCAARILETGRVKSFTKEFEEGFGYRLEKP